ncbi:MAG: PhoH family protein [Clostridiales bacterium]|nr:PhoH family protein [Clostridiales bacterium]
MSQMMSVFGSFDAHVKTIEQALGVVISARDSQAEIRGEEDAVKVAIDTIEALKRMHDHGETIGDWAVSQAMDLVRQGDVNDALSAMTDVIAVTYKGKPVKCKTIGQKNYIKAIKEHTVTICIGPAGTGKTYLAMAMAVNALKRKEISRIILTRPAVEAGERLGFLPGDLQQKVDPYLRPLYDALFDFLGQEQAHRMLETGVIEVAPLAYMRGRTLSDCLVILDEGQNAALETLKMVLTRFGEGAKVVINGDVTQIDLPQEKSSGLKQCAEMLKGIDDIAVVTLNNRDVVRHKLVKEIIKAFEKHEAKEQNRQQGQNRGQYQRKG